MRQLYEKDKELNELPEDTIKDIKKLIRKGAEDKTQLWANALELVHTAYDVAQVQRPDIRMEKAWKQYEDMIAYAVEELSKARGIDGDWRMSSSVFNESAKEEYEEYSIESTIDGLPVNVVSKGKTLEQVIKPFYDHNVTGCDIEIRHRSLNHVCLYFCRDGKRTGDKVVIRKRTK